MASIRQRYWIVKGNRAVRRELKSCITCKKVQGQTLHQSMANLPQDNAVGFDPPFTHVGLDCFGPYYCKRGRAQIKRYGLILICFASRAIHLELLEDMSTSSFINGLRRFIARRGAVKTIKCDRGTNFVGASRELRNTMKTLDYEAIGKALICRDVDWFFNPPQASHFGGSWERQIRTVRKVLSSVLNQQTLTDDTLLTLFCEIETIVNNRPITTVSSDVTDSLPLSPNMLITMKGGPNMLGEFTKSDCYTASRWRRVQYLSDIFWTRWTREYLTDLQRRQKWVKVKRNVSVGDVVLIKDENLPRNRWPLGLVTETPASEDGLIRKATLRCGGQNLIRPISKLIMLLECNECT